jgi:hypothetical protein
MFFINLFIAYALLACQSAEAIPTIEVKGTKFFTSDGDQFFIKGVVYQPDPLNTKGLIDGEQCAIDAELLSDLGANAIRVYAVDPTLNHDACMEAFSAKGIYVAVDMTNSVNSFNRVGYSVC